MRARAQILQYATSHEGLQPTSISGHYITIYSGDNITTLTSFSPSDILAQDVLIKCNIIKFHFRISFVRAKQAKISSSMAYLSSLPNSTLDGSTCSATGSLAPAMHTLVYTLPIILNLWVNPRTSD